MLTSFTELVVLMDTFISLQIFYFPHLSAISTKHSVVLFNSFRVLCCCFLYFEAVSAQVFSSFGWTDENVCPVPLCLFLKYMCWVHS